ncbi:MAG: SBBP repeat-containing protein [Candidatus Latescibacteria bacterium]|nr:SBBP repeat-containing protein [Candidatus Latescibacterota bacterium]
MNKYKMVLVVLIALAGLLPALLFSQVDTAWVRRYNGLGNSYDYARSLAVDGQGNVYVTGGSYGSGNNWDYATIKYNSVGDTIWVQRYNGPGNGWDEAYSLAVDGQGNVYVTGRSVGSGTYSDYATIKYNTNGVQQWVQRYNAPGTGNRYDYAYALALDGQGNVYVTGYCGTSIFGSDDYATIKYNSLGVQEWVQTYNGPGNDNDRAYALAVDVQGNVYVTGYSWGSGTNYDYATIKYDSAGVEQWVQRYNGPGNDYDNARSLAVDGQGNVYVTGESYGSGTSDDYATIKYNSVGDTIWVQRYNGPGNGSDEAYSFAVDGQGNVYVTGRSGYYPNYDYATIKYNSAGVEQWVQRYNGPGDTGDEAKALAIDAQGNVYVTGYSAGSGTSDDYATIKYNSAGVEQWVQRYNGPGNSNDRAYALAVDGQGNVYVTGYSGSGTSADYATIKYVQTAGINELIGSGNGELRVSVYPNPARNYFTVRIPQSADRSEVKIFDVTGKAVKELESFRVGELRVSLDGIKNGIYFVKVNDVMVREKLVVTR